MNRLFRAFALCLASAAPAVAEVDMDRARACLLEQKQRQAPPGLCIDQAHAACAAEPSDSPNLGALCYAQARAGWSDGIKAEMDRIKATAPDQITAIAGIEVKYDLISGLTQCDRMEELAGVGDLPAEDIRREKTRCQARASALAYTRLLWRAASLNPEEK